MLRLLVAATSAAAAAAAAGNSDYRVAVVEHAAYFVEQDAPVSEAEANAIKGVNFAAYVEHATDAAAQGAQMIVFPEDGLTGFLNCERDQMYPYLELAPDPADAVSPCAAAADWEASSPALVNSSCLAAGLGLTVVINFGTKVPCDAGSDVEPFGACPDDGRFQFNTELAFDSAGVLVARHYKSHLFHEPQYNEAPPVATTFEADFAPITVGLLICYETEFSEPIGMLRDQGVTEVAASLWWVNTPPTYDSVAFYQGFSRTHGINFMAAGGVMDPAASFSGTGVFAAGEPLAYYINLGAAADKLLVADVTALSSVSLPTTPAVPVPVAARGGGGVAGELSCNDTAAARGRLARPAKGAAVGGAAPFGQWGLRTVTAVPGGHATIAASSGSLTCTAAYYVAAPQTPAHANQFYGVLAYQGWYEDSYYEEFCAFARCTSLLDCAETLTGTDTTFTYASVGGTFSNGLRSYALAMGDGLDLFADAAFDVTDAAVTSAKGFSDKLLNVAIMASADSAP